MTIDEAIHEQENILVEARDRGMTRRVEAAQLSIEALKETARARRLGPPLKDYRLPGETEE